MVLNEIGDISEEDFAKQDLLLVDLLRNKKQPIHQIITNNKEIFKCSEKTLYRRIDAGIYTVKNYDLYLKPRLKRRNHTLSQYNYKHSDNLSRIGHLWSKARCMRYSRIPRLLCCWED